MSAVAFGAVLVAIPLFGIAAAIVLTIGWDGLAFVVGGLFAALAICCVMAFGITLMIHGWSS